MARHTAKRPGGPAEDARQARGGATRHREVYPPMGRAIVIGSVIILIILIVGGMYLWKTRDRKIGDLDRSEEQKQRDLLEEAASILFQLETPSNLDELDVLTETSRSRIRAWRVHYSKYLREVSN